MTKYTLAFSESSKVFCSPAACTVYSVLGNVHCTVHYFVHSSSCTLETILYNEHQYPVHYKCTVLCTPSPCIQFTVLYTITLYTVHCSVHYLQSICTRYTVLYTAYHHNEHGTLYWSPSSCTVYTVLYCTQSLCTLYTVHCTVHCTLSPCIVYTVWHNLHWHHVHGTLQTITL